MASRGEAPGLSITSLPSLNKKIWGIPKNSITVIGARTSNCKTAMTMQIFMDFLIQGKSVMYMGFEMKQKELMERMFANYCMIDNFELVSGQCNKYEKEWKKFEEVLKGFNFVATDEFGRSWTELADFIESLEQAPDVIILDYIQAISQSEGKAFIDDYILNFRNLCAKREFAGIIVSQCNRAMMERKDPSPQLHDLKGSGYLEELADLVILLHWTGKQKNDYDDNIKFEINIAKKRGGDSGYLEVQYIAKYYKFFDKGTPPRVEEKPSQINWAD